MGIMDSDKVATIETNKLVTKIIDVRKEEFLNNQKNLHELMNKGYLLISNNDFKCSSMVMGIGCSGCGKSTTLNLIYGNTFETGKKVVMLPSNFQNSICKISKYQNYFLYPYTNDRIEEIKTLYRMVKMDYIKIMVAPFVSKCFYVNKETIKEYNPTIPEANLIKKSIEKAFNSDMVSHIIEELAKIKLKKDETLKGKVIVLESLDIVPKVIGSMKTKFLNEFFISGKFIDSITYEQFSENSSEYKYYCMAY
ncbi:hypothetical protein ACTFIY_003624 [Dictyostelium cf. discoideum]